MEPLLELDRDEGKLNIFLTFHKSSLLVGDLKIFLPFTINLDPYLKKVIKEETQSIEDGGLIMAPVQRQYNINHTSVSNNPWPTPDIDWNTPRPLLNRKMRTMTRSSAPSSNNLIYAQPAGIMPWPNPWQETFHINSQPALYPVGPVSNLSVESLIFNF